MQRSLDWPSTKPRAITAQVGHVAIATLAVPRASLVTAFGSPDEKGTTPAWSLVWPCGCEVALRAVSEDERALIVELFSNDTDVEHVLHHLGVGELLSRSDAPSRDAHVLVRQDDNGHRFVIRRFASELAARCARETYEARGHKQLYTLEPRPSGQDGCAR